MMDTNENCWKFFIDRVRYRLKCVLCFSPVGATLKNRARQFPAIVNNTSINWFQSWPIEALRSVSTRFLGVSKLKIGTASYLLKLTRHCMSKSNEICSYMKFNFLKRERSTYKFEVLSTVLNKRMK